MYGGLTLLGLLTQGTAGMPPGDLTLTETQSALWRAGHAHAGVWVILSLVIQVLVDAARLPSVLDWTARLGAPGAAIATSGGFFGLAFHSPDEEAGSRGAAGGFRFRVMQRIVQPLHVDIFLIKNKTEATSSAGMGL